MNPRLGVLLHTQDTNESLACAALMGATVIRCADDLQPGSRCLVDLELATVDDAVNIGQRFRMHGVELIVVARPGMPVPYDLERNLTGLPAAAS